MESCPVTPPRARGTSASGQRVLTPLPLNSPAPPRSPREENAVESTPPTSSGKRRREPSFGGNSSSEGVGDPKARAPTGVPTRVKNGLAFYRGAVSVPAFTEGERQHIESHLSFQRAYDSVDILSKGKPVDGGVDLALAPVVAGAIATMTDLVGVRPDCVHLTTREKGQLHTSHSDGMKFDVRGTVHLGADVLLHGQVDPARSTGDFILSGGDLPQPLVMPMRSGDAYIATSEVLHAPLFHGISPPDQASLSVVCTWSPGRGAFNPWRSQSHPLAESFPSLCGVKAVDGEEAFKVTTTDRVPPKKIKSRIRQSGDFTDGVSLFRAPPEEQASAYHRLGKRNKGKKGSPNGANSCNVAGCSCTESGEACSCDGHVHIKNASVAGRTGGAVQSGEQEKANPNPRGPGAAGVKEFDYRPYRRSIGFHYRGYKENDKLVMSDNTFEFFEYSIGNMENGAWILGTHQFSSQGKRLSSDPYRKDGTRVQTEAKVKRNDGYLKTKARDHGKEQG